MPAYTYEIQAQLTDGNWVPVDRDTLWEFDVNLARRKARKIALTHVNRRVRIAMWRGKHQLVTDFIGDVR